MKSKTDKLLELNQQVVTLVAFMDAYNKSIPDGFPRASVKTLQLFQTAHPTLFKKTNAWSIDKHRKKYMDWHISHPEIHLS